MAVAIRSRSAWEKDVGAETARRYANLRALISRDRPMLESLVWMVALMLAPTALRAAVDSSGLGLPFLTYWPSLLIASLLLELRFAVVFAFIAAMVSAVTSPVT